jgi:hypothetical protein
MNAKQILDQYFPEMRWRCLSLAADLDRIERAPGGPELLRSEPRLQKLRRAIKILLDEERGPAGNSLSPDPSDRAEQIQMTFSDMTPPPPRRSK